MYLQVCSLGIKLYAWTNHINSQDSARACVCVWGSHCNCRLLVSVSNCSVKLAQAVASSMKLQMKFNLLHIHCLHRDHGQDTPRVVEGFNTCICAWGSNSLHNCFTVFWSPSKNTTVWKLGVSKIFWLKKLILLFRKHALNDQKWQERFL